jgi:hypothetical protein
MTADTEGGSQNVWNGQWQEKVYDDDGEIDGPQPTCTGHKDCFCQQLTQHGFLRKLERSARVHFEW